MPPDLATIHRFLAHLRMRSALLSILELVMFWGAVTCGLLLVAFVAGEMHWVHEALPALFWLLLFTTPVVWLLRVVWPRHLPASRWRSAARMLDRQIPALEDLTLSALELSPDGGDPHGASPALVNATISDAALRLRFLPASRLLPWTPVVPWIIAFLVGLGTLSALSILAPERLQANLAAFFAPPAPTFAPSPPVPDGPEREGPELGDITLTLVFPAYLERANEVLENSSGEVMAPLGTQVTLSAKGTVLPSRATIQIEASHLLEATVDETGHFTGSFIVEREGGYSVTLTPADGGDPVVSRRYPIRIEPDGVPAISLRGLDSVNEVSPNEGVPFSYRAQDDHGLTRVDVVVKGPNGASRKLLREISPNVDWDEADVTWYPSEWALPEGGTVELWLEARDNDTVSGPKVGVSARYQMVLSSPERQHDKVLEAKEQLKEALLIVLGDVLIQHAEPLQGKTAAAHELELRTLRQGMTSVLDSFALLRQLMEEDTLEEVTVYRATLGLLEVLDAEWSALERALVQRASSDSPVPTMTANREFKQTRAGFIEALERAVLSMESFANLQRMDAIVEKGEDLKRMGQSLRDMLEQMKRSGDTDVEALMAKLAEMERQLAEMAQKMAQLDRSTAEWFQNPTSDMHEMKDTMEEIRDLLAQGKTEEAMAKLEEQLSAMDALMEALQQMQEGEFGDLRDQVVKDMEGVIAGLEDIERKQKQLLADTEAVRESLMAQHGLSSEDLEEALGETLKKVAQLRQQVDGMESMLDGAGVQMSRFVNQRLRELQDEIDTLEAALRARDLERGLRESWETLRGVRRIRDYLGIVDQRTVQDLGPAREESSKALGTAQSISNDLEQLMERMEQMQQQAQGQGQGLSARQQSLQQKGQALGQRLERYSEGSPMIPERWGNRLKQASQSMGSASDKLRSGALPGGIADEQMVLQELSELRKELENAQQEMAQRMRGTGNQQGRQQGQMAREQGSRERWGGRGVRLGKVDISKEYQAPEEYRREIMEGMKGETPARYKRLNRDYYEKLVR